MHCQSLDILQKCGAHYQNGESIDPFKLLLQDSILSESIFKFRPKFKAILRGSRSWSLPIGQEHQI